MMPVLLTTDILIFLLIAVAVGFALYASRHEHLRAPWRSVGPLQGRRCGAGCHRLFIW